jgi:antitoxin ParD1/3/4
MATMNVSLPDLMKTWVEQQTTTGRFSNASDYVRDLIRRAQKQSAKFAQLQHLVTEGISSGPGTRTMQQIEQVALAKLAR